jgi:hypothetical protein
VVICDRCRQSGVPVGDYRVVVVEGRGYAMEKRMELCQTCLKAVKHELTLALSDALNPPMAAKVKVEKA